MPTITVHNLKNKTIQCHEKSTPLLDILLRETDWMHACGGKGKCTTCKCAILSGAENLSALTDGEAHYRKLHKLQKNERLACQVSIHGDIVIHVPKETQLPHLSYD